jgi:AraC family transcriptional regulator
MARSIAARALAQEERVNEEMCAFSRLQQLRSSAVRIHALNFVSHSGEKPKMSNSESPLVKAVWYIESHLTEAVTLEGIAAVAGISKYHLARSFAFSVNHAPLGYSRARRLSVAAKALQGGARDILGVALDAGYASHEAFTRAFRDHFGLTPEAVRSGAAFDSTLLKEPIIMSDSKHAKLAKPRIEQRGAFAAAGISRRYAMHERGKIPSHWESFVPHIGGIPGQNGMTAYGICYNSDEDGNMDYMCAVEVADAGRVPKHLQTLKIPAAKYAVFAHGGHVSAINATWGAIFAGGLDGEALAEGPMFERYGGDFDSRTGYGSMEIWIPVL